MSKTFDSSLSSPYFGARWKAAFFCPGCLSGKREQEGKGRMQTFQCGRNISGGWCQEEASLSISQQAEICRTSLKVTSALKALTLKPRIVILSLLTQMVSMIQPSPQCPLWLRYKGNDGMGILTRLDKPTPQLTKSAMGVQFLFALAFLLWVRISFTFSIKAQIFNQLPFEIIYSFPVMLQSLLIQTKQ